jgi:hypothetical protein
MSHLERAVILAMTGEIERLRYEVADLRKRTISIEWIPGELQGALVLRQNGEIFSRTRWIPFGMKLQISSYCVGRSADCLKFIKEFGLPEETGYMRLCARDSTISSNGSGRFEITNQDPTISGDIVHVSETDGFEILRKLYRHFSRDCPIPIEIISEME